MKRQFTENQQQAIELRDKNILVSAAAGSGKTAVLVERIIRLISEGEHPADIDRLLVVTFTSAAASEMRERITTAISEKLALQPENEHLQRQSALIHNTQITTIHSFCLFVIRNHFQEIGLDPAFRVADEGEAGLLMQDVLSDVLEEAFDKLEQEREQKKEEIPFLQLLEAYSTGKKETVLEESILSLYRFAISYPWPKEWLKEHGEDYAFSSVEELNKSSFIQYIMGYLGNLLPELAEQLGLCVRICEEPDGPYMYGENLEKSFEALQKAAKAETFFGCKEALDKVGFERLSSKKDDSVDVKKREAVKQIRNAVKKQLEQIKEQFFLLGEEAVLAQCRCVSPLVRELVALTIRFQERFTQEKREKNLIDFSDMEHLALSILCHGKETESGIFVEPTAAALELRSYFQEIMIDEYQDSNLVQECILSCISGEEAGHYNRFMVGDVKQSIYKFRLARPELFMEKFHAYSEKEGDCRLVGLHQNFRSRREVIESVNLIFEQLLARNVGGIDYDDNAQLYYGAVYYDKAKDVASGNDAIGKTEDAASSNDAIEKVAEQEETVQKGSDITDVIRAGEVSQIEEIRRTDVIETNAIYKTDVIEIKKENGTDVIKEENYQTEFLIIEKSEDEEKSAIEQEAEVISQRIKKLMRKMEVLDKDSGLMRPLRYGDIVILLRSGSGIDEVFQEALGKQDIPCYVSSRTGYFQTSEVQVMLQLLRVLDNPLQDIPLFGVLKSCFGSFTDVEIAEIVAAFPGRGKLYQKVKRYAAITDKLSEKCQRFIEWHTRLRRSSVWFSVRELLTKIMEESRYLEYVTALPGGKQRRANAEMLLQKAAAFEKTSFKGLYHFIRYIDQMEKYSIDYGEAGIQDEAADVVRIMTIHKSKGLEFPVCIVAGMGRKMNRRDASVAVLTDMDMGIAVDLVNPALRIKQRTLRKAVLSKKILLDSQAEELRILYVALTRAKEKLIITGVTNDVEKLLQGKMEIAGQEEVVLPYSVRSGAGSFLELLVACVMRTKSMAELLGQYQIEADVAPVFSENRIVCKVVEYTELQENLLEEKVRVINDMESFKINLRTHVTDDKMKEYLQSRFGYRYPHENLQKLYAKTTVSELKRAAAYTMMGKEAKELLEEADGGEHLFKEEILTPYLPLFLRKQEEEEKVPAVVKGNAMHRIMELIEFGKLGEAPEEEGGFARQHHMEETKGGSSSAGWYGMDKLERDIEAWSSQGLLTEEYQRVVNRKKVLHFMRSPLARRMHSAAKMGLLRKEQPFMLGIPANRLSEEFPETEQILVQGIIDVFFEENGEIVLLDYKTDVIYSPKELADKYRVQLDYYTEALERMTGKKVKERILYSFYLGVEVRV